MATDQSALLRVVSQEIIDGLTKERGAFVDSACTRLTRSAIKGSEPYTASVDSLPRDVAADAIGADPKDIDSDLSSLDWDLKQYARKFSITEAEMEDLSQYMDPLRAKLQLVKDYVEIGMDNDLSALLTNGSFNGSFNGSISVFIGIIIQSEARVYYLPIFILAINKMDGDTGR